MTYAYDESSKMAKDARDASEEASKALQAFPRGPMGLTPDDVKFSPEFKAAKAKYDQCFARERAMNAFMVKHFKKEMAADRAAERQAKLDALQADSKSS